MMIVLFIAAITILLYYFIIKPGNYWRDRYVPTGNVTLIFGENYRNVLGKDSSSEFVERIYNKVSHGRYSGVYLFQKPVLVLKSPELIKEICVKKYNNVLNRQALTPDCPDPLMSKNLLALKGQNWKDMRHVISPAFCLSKMKAIHILLCENAQRTVQFFLEKNGGIFEVLAKEVFTRFTNDSMANTMYGLKINSFKNKDNNFYVKAKESTDFSTPWKIFVILMYHISSKLAGLLRITLFDKSTIDFYMNIVKESIEVREKQNIQRPDMLGNLIEARKKFKKIQNIKEQTDENSQPKGENPLVPERYFSDEYIAANLFLMMMAGFDTASTTMCFMAYELAINPEIQKKLMKEIDENRSESGVPSYETIVNMTYMDMVVSECLRKWPSIAHTDRIVTTPFTIEPKGSEERSVFMSVDDRVMIPIFGIHRDPKYYKSPEVFDPERFSPKNRSSIIPYTYLPFGVGPRNCVAMRLVLLKVKVIFFYLLSHFEIVPTVKTGIPIILKRTVVTLTEENGFPLAFKRRNK